MSDQAAIRNKPFTQDRSKLGESPLWCIQRKRFFWVDILGKRLLSSRADGSDLQMTDFANGPTGIVPTTNGRLALSLGSQICTHDPETGSTSIMFSVPMAKGVRFNDMKADSHNMLWAGTMREDAIGRSGAFHRFDRSGGLHWRDGGFAVTNGPAFSPDNTVGYFADSVNRTVYRYDLDAETGQPRGRDIFCVFADLEGLPDGMTTDRDGNLWVALFSGGQVASFSPDGRRISTFSLPTPMVTSLCFGADDFSTLLVTTAQIEMSETDLEAYPQSGQVFALQPGATGVAAHVFDAP